MGEVVSPKECLVCLDSSETTFVMTEESQKIFNICCSYVKDAINIEFWINTYTANNNQLSFCKNCLDCSFNLSQLVEQLSNLKKEIHDLSSNFSENIAKQRIQAKANKKVKANYKQLRKANEKIQENNENTSGSSDRILLHELSISDSEKDLLIHLEASQELKVAQIDVIDDIDETDSEIVKTERSDIFLDFEGESLTDNNEEDFETDYFVNEDDNEKDPLGEMDSEPITSFATSNTLHKRTRTASKYYNNEDNGPVGSDSCGSTVRSLDSEYDVKTILLKLDSTADILWEDVQQKQFMTINQKLRIAQLIAQFLCQQQGDYPPTQKKISMAKSLETAFPFLKKETWFFQQPGRNASGCLENKINTLRRKKIRTQGKILPYKTPSTSVKNVCQNSGIETTSEEYLLQKQWLKDFRSPESQVMAYLRKSFSNRRKEILNAPKNYAVTDEWPVLIRDSAILDVEFDLLTVSKRSGKNIYKKWPELAEKLLKLCELSSINIHEKLSLPNSIVLEGDVLNITTAMIIPHILNSGYIMCGKKKKRISNSESLLYLIQFHNTESNIESLCSSESNRTQPFIIAIGRQETLEFNQYFVMVERKTIECVSFIQALDILFKTYFVLNLNFPTELSAFWNFISSYIFTVEECAVNPSVQYLISSLNSIKL